MAMDIIVSSLAKEVGNPIVGTGRAYFNRKNRENEHGHHILITTVDRVYIKI